MEKGHIRHAEELDVRGEVENKIEGIVRRLLWAAEVEMKPLDSRSVGGKEIDEGFFNLIGGVELVRFPEGDTDPNVLDVGKGVQETCLELRGSEEVGAGE